MASKRLTAEQIIGILSPDIDASKEFQQELSDERSRVYGVYRASKYGNEVSNWSQSVHPTAYNAVEWLKPGLLEVFTGDFFNFTPKKKYRDQPQEELDAANEAAKRIKAYIRYKIFDQMDGEEIIEELIHNALVGHYGIVKVCHRDDYDVETQVLDRVSSDELLQLAAHQDTIEIKGGEEAIEIDPVTQMPVWNGVRGATLVKKKRIYNGFHIEVVPPWEFYLLPGYDRLEKNPFVAHRVKRSLDYIKRQEMAGAYLKGSYDAVKSKVADTEEQPESAGELQKFYEVDGLSSPDVLRRTQNDEPQRQAANEVWVWECYCKLDMEQNGILQPMIVTVCEDVLLREPVVNPYGSAPFELGYTNKEPHKIIGRPVPAVIEDRQKVLSNLLRNIQDSAARSTYGGWLTSSHQAKLMLQKMGPGDVAWTPDINTVKEISPSAPSQFIFEAFNLTKQEVSAESGVNENMQGMDDNTLNKTAAGMNMRMTAGMQRQKIMARRLARAWKRILRRIIDIMRMWPPEDDVEAIGADVMVQPEDLQGHYSIDIEVGVGSQDRMNIAQLLNQYVVWCCQFGIPQGMVTKEELRDAIVAQHEYMDVDITGYIQSPEALAASEDHQMQMQQAIEQAQGMQMQMEQMGKDIQAAQQQIQKLAQENQALKSMPPEDKSLEVAKLRMDAEQSAAELGLKAEVERAKLELEQARLELDRIKLGLEEEKIEMDAKNRAAEMQIRAMQPPGGHDQGEKKPEAPPRPSKRRITVIRDGLGRITGAESIENAEEQEITA